MSDIDDEVSCVVVVVEVGCVVVIVVVGCVVEVVVVGSVVVVVEVGCVVEEGVSVVVSALNGTQTPVPSGLLHVVPKWHHIFPPPKRLKHGGLFPPSSEGSADIHVPPPGWSQDSEKGQQSGGEGGFIPVTEHFLQLSDTEVVSCNIVVVVEVG